MQELTKFYALMEKKAMGLEYGSMTVTVNLKDGIPDLKTLKITSQKRHKYTYAKGQTGGV